MKRFKYIIALTLAMAIAATCPTMAKKKVTVDIYDLSLDENLELPAITNEKHALRVQDYQYDTAVKLKEQNYDVEMTRDNEVIIVTIPASQLFGANDTTLTEVGKVSLKPLLAFLKNPGFYKMIMVMHSDNTGSTQYTLDLTRGRVNSVYDWIEDNASVDYVVPYALGETSPINDNNSVENRKRNRRLEIYLVPEEVMLEQAKHGNVNINKTK